MPLHMQEEVKAKLHTMSPAHYSFQNTAPMHRVVLPAVKTNSNQANGQ